MRVSVDKEAEGDGKLRAERSEEVEPLICANFSEGGGRGNVCGLRLIAEARALVGF